MAATKVHTVILSITCFICIWCVPKIIFFEHLVTIKKDFSNFSLGHHILLESLDSRVFDLEVDLSLLNVHLQIIRGIYSGHIRPMGNSLSDTKRVYFLVRGWEKMDWFSWQRFCHNISMSLARVEAHIDIFQLQEKFATSELVCINNI